MAVTWSDVTAIAPELSTVAAAGQTAILAIVERWVDVGAWGGFADDGKRYLAAHLGSITNRGSSAAGTISSETLGPMSRSYGEASSSEMSAFLSQTSYGTVFYWMMRTAVPRFFVAP